jgi:hypothetical protein
MAVMYPRSFPPDRAKDRKLAAERQVFEALSAQLSDEWHVFYNSLFQYRNSDGRSSDGEADFVLVHPQHQILCLEVKGGTLEQRPDGIYLTLADGSEVQVKSPKEQARVTKHYLLRELKRHLPRSARLSVHTAVCFPRAFRNSQSFQGIEPEEIIYGEEIKSIGARIPEIIRYHQGGDRPGPIAELIEACKKVLLVPERIGSPTALRVLSSESSLFSLTEEQRQTLVSLRRCPRFAVAGGPGTGKTVLAFEQAQWLAEQGRRTLLTCFNSPLASRLKQQVPKRLTNLEVLTFNTLFTKLTGIRGFQIDCERMARAAKDVTSLKFDAIIVDEGQNFKKDWWPIVESLLRAPEEGELQVFYDHHQHLYEGSNAFPTVFVGDFPVWRWHDRLVPPGWAGHRLTLNVRNTRSIAESVCSVVPDLQMTLNDVEGDEIEIRPCSDPSKEVGKKLADLARAGVPLSEVVVLTGQSHEAIKELERNGDARFGEYRWSNNPSGKEDCIYFETIRRFQGLDAAIVLIIDPEGIMNDPGALLIGLTRARSHLAVFAHHGTAIRLMETLGMVTHTHLGFGQAAWSARQALVAEGPKMPSTEELLAQLRRIEATPQDAFADIVVDEEDERPFLAATSITSDFDDPDACLNLDSVAPSSQNAPTLPEVVNVPEPSVETLRLGERYSCKLVNGTYPKFFAQVRLGMNKTSERLASLEFPASSDKRRGIGDWLEVEVTSLDPFIVSPHTL